MLAKQAGINCRSLQDYEQWHKKLSSANRDTLSCLSTVLGCSIEELPVEEAQAKMPHGKLGIPVVLGFQRGQRPFGHTTLLAKCSVSYALSALLRKCGCQPGRANTFEAAEKQDCDCMAWSRKRRTGFISRQGVYESPRPSSYAGLWDKMSRTCGHTHEKADGFFSQN